MALSPITTATSRIHLAQLAAEEDSKREARYTRAWQFYDGDSPDSLENAEPDEADDNIRLDYAKLIVTKGVSFLAGKEGGVSFQFSPPDAEDDPESTEPTPEPPEDDEDAKDAARAAEKADEAALEAQVAKAEAAFESAWPEHKRQLDIHKLATNGGVCGHAWVRLQEDGTVSVLDPGNVRVEWNEDDVEIVERYLIEWDTVDPTDGLGALRRKRIEPDNAAKPSSWTIFDEEHDSDTGHWHLLDETAWEHDYAPVIDTQNLPAPNTYYGEADLEPAVLDQIEQLQSIASDMRRIVRLHGHPVPVILGESADNIRNIDVSIGKLLAIPNVAAKLGQLAVAELTSSLALFQELKTSLFESSHIPKVALGDTANAGPVSGVALQVEYEPMIEQTGTKRITYGYLLCEIGRRILDLKGLKGWLVKLAWPEMMPNDDEADAHSAEAELRMGIVSRQTISERRGYDWTTEQQRITEETPNFDAGTFSYTGGFGNQPPPPPPPSTGPPESVPGEDE